MDKETLKTNIITRVLEAEQKNIYNNYPKTKKQMEEEVEKIIKEEVDKYENNSVET